MCFKKLFGGGNVKELKKLYKMVDRIDMLSDKYKEMTDDELKACTQEFIERHANGESLDDILYEAFAVVREASERTLNMRHFRVQLLGGIVLHQGRIAEMKTGEGKTLVATLPVYLNALSKKGVHVVTVNEYLAARDAEWMGKIYRFLGLSVGVVYNHMESAAKREAYNCDIVYATNSALGFDYLRDNLCVSKKDLFQRELNYALIDEVDSILIDEARTPLIISGAADASSELYASTNKFVRYLKNEEDFEIEEKDKTIRLLDSGIEKAEKYFNLENLGDIENTEINHHIQIGLKAYHIMKRDKDYMVKDGEVIIVDQFTGRLMIGRRYSDGLHQAIEAKEGVKIQNENKTFATITIQNYFRLYRLLAGMTGTAKTEEEEFNKIYALDVVEIPTNLPMARIDYNDQLYKTKQGKYNAIIEDIKECSKKGQPVLVGTVTVEKSEELSARLKKERIFHVVLNAKNHEKEAEIIAQAGKIGAVTIATNMAGRGTDIVLGGNAEYMAKSKLISIGYTMEEISAATSYAHTDDEKILKAKADYEHYLALFKKDTEQEKLKVIEAGGLRIIGTERHDSRRIDNQLRGRAGRQGDIGSTVFYISMEDDVARIFGGERMYSIADRFNLDENMPIANKIISNQIERAQRVIESRNFSARKHVLSYDDVINQQRAIIYKERQKVLNGEDIHEEILTMLRELVEDAVIYFANDAKKSDDFDIKALNNALLDRVFCPASEPPVDEDSSLSINELIEDVYNKAVSLYESKIVAFSEKGIDFKEVERVMLLKTVDKHWIEHIDALNMLKEGVGLRAYAQQDPIVTFKKESYEMFDDMTFHIKRDIIKFLVYCQINNQPENRENRNLNTLRTNRTITKVETVKNTEKKIGRNDPCSCGSGKKYKNCCGKT